MTDFPVNFLCILFTQALWWKPSINNTSEHAMETAYLL